MAQELLKGVIPVFLMMVVAEAAYSAFRKKGLYDFKDTLSNLQCGVVQFLFETFLRVGFFGVYYGLYEWGHLFDLPTSALGLFLAVVIVDFATYWAHRASHRVNLFWAAHLVHHQSKSFNLSAALRLSAIQRLLNFPIFFAPLALLGLPVEAFVFGNVIVGINGFWNHTRLIGRIQVLEWFIVTPSHHRVHHACNAAYIDKNYSNVFPIWDTLFGTSAEETEEPVFGITHELKARTPIEANLEFFRILKANMDRAPGFFGKLRVLFGRPEDLDYSCVVSFREEETKPMHRLAAVISLLGALGFLGAFMAVNRGIGQNEFSLLSLLFAGIAGVLAWGSGRLLIVGRRDLRSGPALIPVRTREEEREFLAVVDRIYANDPHYIRPLDSDLRKIFSTETNPHLTQGKFERWIARDSTGRVVGRIAAFVTRRNVDTLVGGFGFFDCVEDEEVARRLLDQAESFLRARGALAMEGPIQPGERDQFWGARVEGQGAPGYGQNYNPAYLVRYLHDHGLVPEYEQVFFAKDLREKWPARAMAAADRFREKSGVRFVHLGQMPERDFARACRDVYNSAWRSHPEFKEMTEAECLAMFERLRPIADPELLWLAYDRETPVGFLILIPEINELFHGFRGKFGPWQKLRFLARKKFRAPREVTGLAFGIVPRFQGTGLSFGLLDAAVRLHQRRPRYDRLVLNWIGDFNPRMMRWMESVGAKPCRKHATFRKPLPHFSAAWLSTVTVQAIPQEAS